MIALNVITAMISFVFLRTICFTADLVRVNRNFGADRTLQLSLPYSIQLDVECKMGFSRIFGMERLIKKHTNVNL